MTEALITGKRCFLEKKAWKDVMRATIIPDDDLISDRSEIVIELMILKSNIPGYFVDVTNVILSEYVPDYMHNNVIASKIQQLRADLIDWHARWQYLLSCAPVIQLGSAEYDRKCKTYATYLSCVIIASRLLSALSPTERAELEMETRISANQMLDLELEVKSTSSAACLFMAQTLGVAQATLACSQDWLKERDEYSTPGGDRVQKLESVSPEGFVSPGSLTFSLSSRSESGSVSGNGDTPEQRDLIEVWKFERWNELCGRKMR